MSDDSKIKNESENMQLNNILHLNEKMCFVK